MTGTMGADPTAHREPRMTTDMTDRIEHDRRIVKVFREDADHALVRWRKRGWVLEHSAYEQQKVAGRYVVHLHLRRPKGATRR